MSFQRLIQVFLCVGIFITSQVFAISNFPQETPSVGRKVRNLGMGNVGVALLGHPDSSPFYNPAGLNDLEKGRIQFLTPTLELSGNTFGLIFDLFDLGDHINNASSDPEKTRILNEFYQARVGEFHHFRFALDLVNYSQKNFAAGLLFDERLDVAFRSQATDAHFSIRNLGDIVMYVSGSHDFWDKLLQVGVTLRPTVRMSMDEADEVIEYNDIQDDDNGDARIKTQIERIYKEQHFSIGADIGLKTNLAFAGVKDLGFYKYLKPQLGFTWQNIGSPDFDSAPGNEQSMSVGFAVHPDLWKLKNSVALDLRDLNQERAFLSKVHFGMESKFPWLLTLRAGVSQGYLTAGTTLNLLFCKLDAAIYSEEIGNYTRQDKNLRFAVAISFDI